MARYVSRQTFDVQFITRSDSMKVRFLWAAVCTGVLVGVFAFAGSQAAADDPAPKLEQDGKESPGRTVFMRARCFACHGEYGYGGVGPRFRENRFLAMGDYVAGQILIGRGVMPSFADALDDKQIAEVASYIRNSWGNQFGSVKPEEVAKVRQEIRQHPPHARPHLPPQSGQQNIGPTPPDKPLPPGKATLPGQNNQ
jgi:mono/diheme cytochrome c family protein